MTGDELVRNRIEAWRLEKETNEHGMEHLADRAIRLLENGRTEERDDAASE